MPETATVAFDPADEQLLVAAREREQHGLSRSERITYWVSSAVLAGACVLLMLAFGAQGRHPHTWVVALLVVSYALASRLEFEVGSTLAVATELVLVEMLFLLPPAHVPLCVLVGNALGGLPEYLRGIVPAERVLIRISSSWFALGPALVFAFFHAPSPALTWQVLAVLALALAAQFAADLVSSSAREWAALRVPPRQFVSQLALVFAIDLALAPLGLLAAVAATENLAALLLPLPLLFVIGLSTRERQRRFDQALELSSAYRGTALLLGDVIEADDAYTGEHSRDVVELMLAVCDELKVDPRTRRDAEFAALLHDVGKIHIPASIINKPGPLSPRERAIIEPHTIDGRGPAARRRNARRIGHIVRSCHERWDGHGYPDGLAGTEIPLVARIVCCCDAYNAMTTDSRYRRAKTIADALAEIEAGAGTQFDPAVVTRSFDSSAPALQAASKRDTSSRSRTRPARHQ